MGRRRRRYIDYNLIIIMIFLMLFGLVMLYSASLFDASAFSKQLLFSVVGLLVFVVASAFEYPIYQKLAVFLLAVSVLMLFSVYVPGLGHNVNGATRWIKIGPMTIQPAELMKVAVIIFNAHVVDRMGKYIGRRRTLLLFVAMAAVEVLLAWRVTDNLSTGLIIGGITIGMIFVAYPKYLFFALSGALLASLGAGFIYYVSKVGALTFRFERILIWLHPEQYTLNDKNYQTIQSLYAIGSGGFWGKGLGSSVQKLILPEAQNDMIFAIICEELGLVGAFIVMLMFIILLYRLLFIARNAPDLFGGMLTTGIFIHMALQVVLNIAVVTNTIPPTGITLPFISSGGSALWILLAEMGIAINVSRHIRFDKP